MIYTDHNELKAKLKVGDKVRLLHGSSVCDGISSAGGSYFDAGATIDSFDKDFFKVASCSNKHQWSDFKDRKVEVLNHNSFIASTMSNVIEKFQNMFASDEDKLLTKYEVEKPIGTPTQDGLNLLLNILYKAHRAEVIAKVKEIAAADDAATKAKE